MTDTMSAVTDEATGTDVNDDPVSKRPSRLAERRAIRAASPARAAVTELAESGALDGLFAKIDGGELDLTGDGGFVTELIKASLERGLAVELTDHLGYEKGDRKRPRSPTPATARPRRRWRPRPVTSTWPCPATVTARSSRGWSPRACAAWAAWTT